MRRKSEEWYDSIGRGNILDQNKLREGPLSCPSHAQWMKLNPRRIGFKGLPRLD